VLKRLRDYVSRRRKLKGHSRFLKHAPDALLALYILAVLGTVADAFLYRLSPTAFAIVFPLVNGGCIGLLFSQTSQRLVERKQSKWADKVVDLVPTGITRMGTDEETDEQIVSVTLGNGDARLIRLPGDYHPAQDGGELLMRTASPELFEKIEKTEGADIETRGFEA
jgi:hypothetical protein